MSIIEAVKKANFQLAEKLILDGADVNETDKWRGSCLSYVCMKRNLKLVEMLVERGADVNSVNFGRCTPLMEVCSFHGSKKIAKYLIENGSNVHHLTIDGWSTLMHATRFGHYSLVKLMLENGVDPNIKSMMGVNALYLAASYGYFKILKCLKKSENKEKALVSAAREKHLNIVNYLLKFDLDKQKLLFKSVKKGVSNLVIYSLENGAIVDDCKFKQNSTNYDLEI